MNLSSEVIAAVTHGQRRARRGMAWDGGNGGDGVDGGDAGGKWDKRRE